ncbi:MAG: FG-GAP-like repeat-containing protein, partial [Flavobacterium nitrogenifigens]
MIRNFISLGRTPLLICFLFVFQTVIAQAPLISTINPTSGPPKTAVVISGSNFGATVAENIVYFGAVKAEVTTASPTSLTVLAPVGATYQPISVLNTATLLKGYSTESFVTTFTPNKGSITSSDIAPAVNFATVSNAGSGMEMGDLDGDGKIDLAVLNAINGSGAAVLIFRNTSTIGSITGGSFTSAGSFPVQAQPEVLAIDDLDGDGKLDLAVTNRAAGTISILRNTSSGAGVISFATQITYPAGISPMGIVIHDFDGDGKGDIINANYDASGVGSISVFKNTSAGAGSISFAAASFFTANHPTRVELGDFDNDKNMDIVVTNFSSSSISVYRNISSGSTISFSAASTFPASASTNNLAVGDLNNDGKVDIVLGNETVNSLFAIQNISSGVGDINFGASISLASAGSFNRVAINDLDGDGKLDIASGTDNAFLSVLRNTSASGGGISFSSKVDFADSNISAATVIGDFDGDGRNDIAALNNSNNLSVFRNTAGFAPTVQATNVTFSNIGGTSITADWTNGNGTSRAVFILAGSSGSPVPVDYTTYIANPVFGSGTQIGSSGWYCVYNGTGTTVNITGLNPGTAYRVMTVEYNSSFAGNELYFSATGTGNPAGVMTYSNVSSLNSLSLSSGSLNPSFTSGTTAYTAVVDNTITSLTVTPVATNSSAIITVNGTTVASGSASGAIALAVGDNVITTLVTAQDGVTTTTYTITVHRTGLPPIVTSFSPSSGPVGTTVTITGLNFGSSIAENIVFFGATRAVVSAASTTSITVTVPVGATYMPLTVLNTSNRLIGSAALPFSTTFNPSKTNITTDDFAPIVNFSASESTYRVAIGDLDGDGKADIAVTIEGHVALYRNTSVSGTINATSFAPAINIDGGPGERGIALGDLDGDGKLDLVETNFNTSNVSYFRNTSSGVGDISFTARAVMAGGTNPIGLVIKDIDGDGKNDFVTSNFGAATVSVFRNLTTTVGTLQFAAKQDFSVGTGGYAMVSGDFDNDGKVDLAVANNGANSVSVLRNTSSIGAVSFATQVASVANTGPYSIAIGDVNGDDKLDLAVGYNNSTSVSILRNASSGVGNVTFDAKIDFATPTNPRSVGISDFNGDGKPDIVATSSGNILSVFKNTAVTGGAISLSNRVDFPANPFTGSVAIGDLDGDGRYDVVTANSPQVNSTNVVGVFRNNLLFAPTIQATDVTFTNTTGTATTASWTNGNGTSRAVFMYAGSSGSPTPLDYTTYTANPVFGLGTQIGTSGWYCIYKGTGATVNVSGLLPGTTYQVMVVEYNGSVAGNEMYQTAVSTGNPAEVTTLSNIASLSSLNISEGTLNPVFASATTVYTATVDNTITNLTVTPVTTDTNATVTVNGIAVASGSPSDAIALVEGDNVITTVVTAQDGSTTATYTITVTRTKPVIVNTGTLLILNSTYGTPSVSGTFNVSGTNMLEGILVAPPIEFEVSADNVTFTDNITIGAAGTISAT